MRKRLRVCTVGLVAFVLAPPLAVGASFAPKNGTSGHVNISGEGSPLPAPVQVLFGSTPATSVKYVNPRFIRVEIPSGLPNGVVPLKLVSGEGVDVLGGFTIGPPLTGLQLQDVQVSRAGATVELLGNGFKESGRDGSPTVRFDDQALTGRTIDNSLILVEVPARPGGTCFTLSVTFSDGATANSTICFTPGNLSFIILNQDTTGSGCLPDTTFTNCSQSLCLVAKAVDTNGAPLAGVVILFTLQYNINTYGDTFTGVFNPSQATTNANGEVFSRLSLGSACPVECGGGSVFCTGEIVATTQFGSFPSVPVVFYTDIP